MSSDFKRFLFGDQQQDEYSSEEKPAVNQFKFVVTGECVGKMRHRSAIVRGHIHNYAPKEQVTYENWVRLCYKLQAEKSGFKGFGDLPFTADITIFKSLPKSVSNKKKRAMVNGEIPNISKPDVDNLCKSILDSIQSKSGGGAFADDKQCVSVSVRKFYAESDFVLVELFGLDLQENCTATKEKFSVAVGIDPTLS